MENNKIVAKVGELDSLRLKLFEVAKGAREIVQRTGINGFKEEVNGIFKRIRELSLDLITTGSADGMSAVADLYGSLKQYAGLKIEHPEARDIFVLALCERYQINNDMYARIVDGGISQELRCDLFLSLVDYDPLNDSMGTYLNGIDDENFIRAYVAYFSKICEFVDVSSLIGIACKFKDRASVDQNQLTYIDEFSANIHKLAKGYLKIIKEAELEWPEGQIGNLKEPFHSALCFKAEFLCGLHNNCNNQLTEKLCRIGLRNPTGLNAYLTFERHGFTESVDWQVKSQRTSRNSRLAQHHSYAITNDAIAISLPEAKQFGSRYDLEQYLGRVVGAPRVGKNSFQKLKSIIDYVLGWDSEKFKVIAVEYLLRKNIDPKLLDGHVDLLGDKFSSDLGM